MGYLLLIASRSSGDKALTRLETILILSFHACFSRSEYFTILPFQCLDYITVMIIVKCFLGINATYSLRPPGGGRGGTARLRHQAYQQRVSSSLRKRPVHPSANKTNQWSGPMLPVQPVTVPARPR